MRIYKDLYEKVRKLTLTDYEVDYKEDPDDEYVYVYSEDKVNSMLDELIYLVDTLQEQYDDLKQDVANNYRYIGGNYDI